MSEFLGRFGKIWEGGYFEGDPRDPVGRNTYTIFGFVSVLYVAYLTCIKPYVRPGVTVLEIGPGRGAWTKAIAELKPDRVFAVDVVDPHYAGFWDYVGEKANVTHLVTDNFRLDEIADASIDHFFSFGVFCHLKPEMSIAYFDALARKMKPDANGFVLIGDFEKFNACHADYKSNSIWKGLAGTRHALIRKAIGLSVWLWPNKLAPRFVDDPSASQPGAWFHFGVTDAVRALETAGFEVIESDMGINQRDPIIHFRKR